MVTIFFLVISRYMEPSASTLSCSISFSSRSTSGRIVFDPKGVGECSRTVRWNEIERATGSRSNPGDWEKREPFLHGRKNIIERNEKGSCHRGYITRSTSPGVLNVFKEEIKSPNICDTDLPRRAACLFASATSASSTRTVILFA